MRGPLNGGPSAGPEDGGLEQGTASKRIQMVSDLRMFAVDVV